MVSPYCNWNFFNEPQINKSIFIIIMGIILIISGLFMHHLSHKAHRQAHLPKESITSLITTGIYAKIRHPGYLGYFLGYAGIFLVIGSCSMLIPIFYTFYLLSIQFMAKKNFYKVNFLLNIKIISNKLLIDLYLICFDFPFLKKD